MSGGFAAARAKFAAGKAAQGDAASPGSAGASPKPRGPGTPGSSGVANRWKPKGPGSVKSTESNEGPPKGGSETGSAPRASEGGVRAGGSGPQAARGKVASVSSAVSGGGASGTSEGKSVPEPRTLRERDAEAKRARARAAEAAKPAPKPGVSVKAGPPSWPRPAAVTPPNRPGARPEEAAAALPAPRDPPKGTFYGVSAVIAKMEGMKSSRYEKLDTSAGTVGRGARAGVARIRVQARTLGDSFAEALKMISNALPAELESKVKKGLALVSRVPEGPLGKEVFLEHASAGLAKLQDEEETERLKKRGRRTKARREDSSKDWSEWVSELTADERAEAATIEVLPLETLDAASKVVESRGRRRQSVLDRAGYRIGMSYRRSRAEAIAGARVLGPLIAEAFGKVLEAQASEIGPELDRVREGLVAFRRSGHGEFLEARRIVLGEVSDRVLPELDGTFLKARELLSGADVGEDATLAGVGGEEEEKGQGFVRKYAEARKRRLRGRRKKSPRPESALETGTHASGGDEADEAATPDGFPSLYQVLRTANRVAAWRWAHLAQSQKTLARAARASIERLRNRGEALGEEAAKETLRVPELQDDDVPAAIERVEKLAALVPRRVVARACFCKAFNDVVAPEDEEDDSNNNVEQQGPEWDHMTWKDREDRHQSLVESRKKLWDAAGASRIIVPEEASWLAQSYGSERLRFLAESQTILRRFWANYKRRLDQRAAGTGAAARYIVEVDASTAQSWELAYHAERIRRLILLTPRSPAALQGSRSPPKAHAAWKQRIKARHEWYKGGRVESAAIEVDEDGEPLPLAFVHAWNQIEDPLTRIWPQSEPDHEDSASASSSSSAIPPSKKSPPIPISRPTLPEDALLSPSDVMHVARDANSARFEALGAAATQIQRTFRAHRERVQASGEALAEVVADTLHEFEKALDRELDNIADRTVRAVRAAERRQASHEFLERLNQLVEEQDWEPYLWYVIF